MMPDEQLNKNLKAYFSRRENLPCEAREELRRRLAEKAAAPESFQWLLVLVPCAVLLSLAAIIMVFVVFGYGAFLLAAAVYTMSMTSGAAVILVASKNNRIEERRSAV